MSDGRAGAEDLRRVDQWLKWVGRQEREVRDSLAMASHQFVKESDTIYIVFDYRAVSSLSAELCEKLMALIWAHYKVNIVEWADRVLEGPEVLEPLEPDLIMPNIAVEIAPPASLAH